MRDNFTSNSVSPSAVPDPCVRDCFSIWFGVRDYSSCDGSYYSLHAHNTILISLDKKPFIGENRSRNSTRADLIDKVELPHFPSSRGPRPIGRMQLTNRSFVGTWKSAAKTEAKPASQELRGAPGSEDTELAVLMELEVRNSHLTRPRLALEIWGSDFLYLR